MPPKKVPRLGLPLIVIAGPTGSGKSALAIDLALRFEGEIVNYDSLQLYRGFDIGTAKTPVADRRRVPHHLFDVLDPEIGYSAGEYSRAARAVLQEIASRRKLPILAGGTGFYLKALLEGLPSLPERDEQLRSRLAAKETRKPGTLHRLLARWDPSAAAKIHANDIQKLTRALEVRLTTGRSLPSRDTAEPLEGWHPIKIGLNPDRTELVRRLDQRVIEMFEGGLLDEIRSLLDGPNDGAEIEGARGNQGRLSGVEKPFESLGYKQGLAHIRGSISLESAIESTQAETRQYAKRQLTWFRRDTEIHWLAAFGDNDLIRAGAAELVAAALSSSSPTAARPE